MLTTESQILSEITTHLKYVKFVPEKNRRETWGELVTRNKEMHLKKFPQLAEEIEASGIDVVEVRSALTCESAKGICAKCYGQSLSTLNKIQIGEAVGVIAAQ